jgi:serine/threonine protein kinase
MTRSSPPEAEAERGWERARSGRQEVRRRIGKYWLLDEIGSGGMAVVYLGVMRGMNAFTKLVVLKILHPHMVESSEAIQMFMTEARLTARLNHPNIVQTFEANEDEGHCTIVMEFLDGRSLQALMNETELGARGMVVALKILMGALRGLHHAHELLDFDGTPLGVVHRDISPHNIFATFDGQAKVLDFGIAKLAQSQHTETGVIKGKVRYMSPEQAGGEDVDRRTDIFAAGIILWEILTGRRLWEDKTDIQVFQCLLAEKGVRSPRSENAAISATLEAICMRALAFDKNERFATGLEMLEALNAALAELPSRERRVEPADVLNDLFGAARDEHRQRIAALLAGLGRSEKWDFRSPSTSPGPQRDGAPAEPREDASGTFDERKRRFSAWLVAGVALAGGLALAAALFVFRSAPIPAPAPAPLSSATPAVAPPQAVLAAPKNDDLVTVAITVEPANAALTWDGTPVAGSALVRREPRNSGSHTVRADAEGFLSESRTVDTARDQELSFHLQREAVPAPARARAVRRGVRAKPSTSGGPAKTAAVSATHPTGEKTKPTLDTASPW